MHIFDISLKKTGTLQMFAGIYGDFTGKWVCGGFKFTGIAGNMQCLQKNLRITTKKCREYGLQG